MKAVTKPHIYNKKRIQDIDKELKKYVNFQKGMKGSMAVSKSNLDSGSSRRGKCNFQGI